MRFKQDVIGPDFDNADIINFDFGEAEISLVVPEDIDADPALGFVASQNQTVLPVEPNIHWSIHPFGFRVFDLVNKSWSYYDEFSDVRVAVENFYLNLIEVPDDKREEMNPLSKTGFIEWLFKFFKMMAVEGDTSLHDTEQERIAMRSYSMPMSVKDIEKYDAGALAWPMLTIRIPQGDDDEDTVGPDYFIYIPLSERLFLYIDSSISIISREGAPARLSRTEIIQLKRDILMEILANIRVTYSPRILSLIEEQNSA